VLGVPAVYAIAPSLAIGYVLTAVLAEQATPLSAVILLFAALLLPYRFDRRGQAPILAYLDRFAVRRRGLRGPIRAEPSARSTPRHELPQAK
jgi:hypothetical protein